MNKDIDLLYEEKRILALYRQMLRKEYNVDNDKKYENNNELQNHVEMQKAIYLAYKLLWIEQYGFIFDTYGPKSNELELIIKKLENKKNEIKKYYSLFDNNIYSYDTLQKLNDFCEQTKIMKLEKFTKLVYDIINEPYGIELLADLCYIASTQIPGAHFEIANRQLQIVRPVFNNKELNKFVYRCLEEYDLINPVESQRGKVKRI